jgi:hypothetical protein
MKQLFQTTDILAAPRLIRRFPKTFACGGIQVSNPFGLDQRSHHDVFSLQCSELFIATDLATALGSGVRSVSGRNAINAPRSLQQHFTTLCSTRYAYKRPNANPSSLPAPISPGILFLQINMRLPARRRRLFAARPSAIA